jgi:hypothetical protein
MVRCVAMVDTHAFKAACTDTNLTSTGNDHTRLAIERFSPPAALAIATPVAIKVIYTKITLV